MTGWKPIPRSPKGIAVKRGDYSDQILGAIGTRLANLVRIQRLKLHSSIVQARHESSKNPIEFTRLFSRRIATINYPLSTSNSKQA